MNMGFGAGSLTLRALVRYGLVEILGEDWVVVHPVESLADIKQTDLVTEGTPAITAQGIAMRAGSSLFDIFYTTFGPQMGFLDGEFQLQPVRSRLSAGLHKVLAQMTALGGEKIEFIETEADFQLGLPVCGAMAQPLYCGFFEAYFEWASNGKTFLYQQHINAEGQAVVSFNKQPLDV